MTDHEFAYRSENYFTVRKRGRLEDELSGELVGWAQKSAIERRDERLWRALTPTGQLEHFATYGEAEAFLQQEAAR